MKSSLRVIGLLIFFISASLQLLAHPGGEDGQLVLPISIKINSSSMAYQEQRADAWSCQLQGDKKQLEKAWVGFWKANYTAKLKRSKGQLVAEEVAVVDIMPSALLVVSEINALSGSNELKVAYALEGSNFLNQEQHATELAALKQLFRRFCVEWYSDLLNAEIDDATKVQKKQNKTLESLNKERAGHSSDIAKAETKMDSDQSQIAKIEDEIRALQQKIGELENRIAENSQQVEKSTESLKVSDEKVATQEKVLEETNLELSKLKEALAGLKL